MKRKVMAALAATVVSLAIGLAGAGTAAASTTTSGAASAHPGSPAAGVRPLTSGNIWLGADGYMWYDSSNGLFYASSNDTPLSPAADCNGSGFCEHKLPNGKCMEWESGPNTVSAAACSGIDRQLWYLANVGGGYWEWVNDYADIAFVDKGYCIIGGTQLAPVLTAEPTSNDQLDMRCEGQGPGLTYQEWSPVS